MRRRHNQNVRDYSKSEVLERVGQRMVNRIGLLAPCPVEPKEIYRYLWTKEERAALRLLKSSMLTLLHRDTDLTLQWDVQDFLVETPFTDRKKPLHLFVQFGAELPLPCTETWRSLSDKVGMSRLPASMVATLVEWGARWTRLEIEREQVYNKVDRVFSECNTMGQLHRVWPNLCSFLPERGQEIVRNMKVRSRLPKAMLHYDDDKDPENEHPILDEEWTPAALAPYDAIITEALLLPDETISPDWPVRIIHGNAC